MGGVYVADEIVEKIRNAPKLRTRKDLRWFLGLPSYYRRPIKNIAKVASSFTEKTSEKNDFECDYEMNLAFEELREALCT